MDLWFLKHSYKFIKLAKLSIQNNLFLLEEYKSVAIANNF